MASCRKCDTSLTRRGYCRDITCPYSDHKQGVELDEMYEKARGQVRRKHGH